MRIRYLDRCPKYNEIKYFAGYFMAVFELYFDKIIFVSVSFCILPDTSECFIAHNCHEHEGGKEKEKLQYAYKI